MENKQITNLSPIDELAISSYAKKIFKKMHVLTLEDACHLKLKDLNDLVKGNIKCQAYVDELWEIIHNNNFCFADELDYYKTLENYGGNLSKININELFMSKNARHFLENCGGLTGFFNKLKRDNNILKSFLCLVIVNEQNDTLEKLFGYLGNDGKILSSIIKEFKPDIINSGPLMPVFVLFPEKNIYYPLIRYNCWLISDLLNLKKEEVVNIPRLGPSKANKIITTLENYGYSFSKDYNVVLSLAYFKIEMLNLEPSIVEKLKAMQIFTLEQLLGKQNFNDFTDTELLKLQEAIAKLELKLNDKLLAMNDETLEKRYNHLILEECVLKEKLDIINREKNMYQRILNLKKEIKRKD